jgi:Ran GTPase-activating protein (RanGAP) involved in mRNA processing and transport
MLHGILVQVSFQVFIITPLMKLGISIHKYFNMRPQDRSLLYQEIQALALKSKKLRRMDFTNALPRRRPKDTFDVEGQEIERDPGCEIVSALLPLCRGQLTNVSWIVLSGIELGETDLDDLIPALHEPKARLRAVECSRSGLSDRGIMQLLSHMERQNATMECVNISDNPGRVNLERFTVSMSRFSRIRKLDLSRITRTSGEKPLIEAQVMLSWKLEELIMNGVPLNEETLATIAAYLASDMSDCFRLLQMDQCNLNGSHVALLMRAMTRTPGEGRSIQLHVSANRLEKGVGEIVNAIEENHTPTHLVMRMIEFTKEDHFKQLLEALRTNNTIRSLDISKASLPYDAGPETCDALRQLFIENETLEELDISGEHAHLEVTRFGIGLNQALTGLRENKALKVLRIEYQNLGLEGANTLSSVIEANSSLTHIYCEHNGINLQGFTILINALAKNYTLLHLPFMQDDQDESMKRINENMRDSRKASSKERTDHGNKISVRRTLTTLRVSKPQTQDLTPQDLDAVVRVLNDRWNTEIQRLAIFLQRNKNIADGVEGYGPDGDGVSEEHLRPTTAMSDRGILEQVLSNTTPKVELADPVEGHVSNMAALAIRDEARGEENEKAPEVASSVDEITPKKRNRNTSIGDETPKLPAIKTEKIFESRMFD